MKDGITESGINSKEIRCLDDYEKDLEHSGQRPNTYKQRIERLKNLGEIIGNDPLQEIYRLYYKERVSIPEINRKLKVYASDSSLHSLFVSLGWERRDPNEEHTVRSREPLRQESFQKSLEEKSGKQIRKFKGEIASILEKSQYIPRKVFIQEEFTGIKTNIRKFFYLLEAFDGITKEVILSVCRDTKVESSYYTKALNLKVKEICEREGISPIPEISDGSMRAWVNSQKKITQ